MKLFNVRLGVLFLVLFSFVFPAIGFGAETVPSPGYLDLDGTRYVKIPKSNDFAIPAGGTMTITMRVTLAEDQQVGKKEVFLSSVVRYFTSLTDRDWTGYEFSNPGESMLINNAFVRYSTPGSIVSIRSTKNLTPKGIQKHLTLIHDGKKIYFYIDGELANANNKDEGTYLAKNDVIPNKAGVIIGAGYKAASNTLFSETAIENFFKGEIDDVRFYRDAFSQEDVRRDMGSETFLPDKTVLAAYDFSDLSGGTVRDISGKEHHGKLMGIWPINESPSQGSSQFYAVNIAQNEHADITLTVNGQPLAGGSEVQNGTIVNVTVEPHEGYEVDGIYVNNEKIEGAAFIVKGISTVSTKVDRISSTKKFKVSVEPQAGVAVKLKNDKGEVIITGTEMSAGSRITVEATPREGYVLEGIYVNDEKIEGNGFTLWRESVVKAMVRELTQVIPEKFKVEYSADGQGTLMVKNGEASIASGEEVDNGAMLTCVATPADGYNLKSLTVNGIETQPDANGNFSVEVTENIIIKAVFEPAVPTVAKYKVMVEQVEHVTVVLRNTYDIWQAPGSEWNQGDRVKVEVIPADGYELIGIYVNGDKLDGNSFVVTEESTVKAEVRQKEVELTKYLLTINAIRIAAVKVYDEAGNIVANNTSVPAGTKLRVDVRPDDGYELDCIKVNDEPIEGNTFIVEGDCTISVVIKEKTATEKFKVEYTTEGGGSLTVKNGEADVASGDEVEKGTMLACQVSAGDGYRLKTLTVNEVETQPDAAGNFTVEVTEAVVIKAVFEKEPSEFTVTIEPVEDVSVTLSAENIGEIESGSAVAEGTIVMVTAAPADGYEVEGIYVNDMPIQGSTFTVRGDCRVRVVVKEKEAPPAMYAVTVRFQPNVTVALTDKDGNEITSGTLLREGTVVKVSAIAAEGYELAGIYLNGAPLVGDTFTVSELSEVYAVAKAVEPTHFTVSFSASGSGKVSATVDGEPVLSGEKVESGKTLLVTCVPEDGYMLGSATINSRNEPLPPEDIIPMTVDSDLDFVALFRERRNVYFKVVREFNDNVSVKFTDHVDDQLLVGSELQEGSTITVIPTPADGYEVEGIYVNGQRLRGDTFTLRGYSRIEVKVRKAEGETPELAKYAVKVTERENVTVKLTDDSGDEIASGSTLPVGTLVTVTATPAEGYELEGIYVNNVKLTGENFTLTVESTVEAKVKPKSPTIVKYTVTIVEQENVTVTLKGDDDATIPSGTSLPEGTVVTVMATPATGYELEYIYLNGEKLDGNTFTVACESKIKAVVKKTPTGKEKYAVKVLAQSNVSVRLFDESGTIIPSGTPVLEGTVVTVEVRPDNGYELEGIYRNDAKLDGNTFVVTGESVIKAIVRAAPPVEPSVTKYVVTIEPSRNGTITLSDEEGTRIESGSAVAEGTLVLIAAVADHGYKLAAVTLNREVIAADRFIVTGDTEVGAIFEVDPAASGDEPSVPEKVIVSYSSVGPGTVSVVSGDGAIASGGEVEKGSEITLVCEPQGGARLAALKVTGAEVPVDFDGRAVIVAGNDIEIKAEFAMINYTLIVTESGRGHAAVYGNVDAAGVPAGDAMAGGSVIHYGDVLHLFAVPDKGYTLISAAVSNNGVITVLSVDEDFTQRADGSLYKAISAEGDVMIELRFSTVSSGIDSTRNDGSRPRYYNLHGIEIPADRLSPGIYIMIDGAVKEKILIR